MLGHCANNKVKALLISIINSAKIFEKKNVDNLFSNTINEDESFHVKVPNSKNIYIQQKHFLFSKFIALFIFNFNKFLKY